jgi:hypothetical protein
MANDDACAPATVWWQLHHACRFLPGLNKFVKLVCDKQQITKSSTSPSAAIVLIEFPDSSNPEITLIVPN